MSSKVWATSRALVTKEVNYRKDGMGAGPTYLMLVDLSNGSGKYKHVSDSAIHMLGFHATAIKSNMSDTWRIFLGTILSINGTEATIGYKRPGTVGIRDTGSNQVIETFLPGDNTLSYAVSNGDFRDCLTNHKETVSEVNTGVTLEDAGGDNVAPSVGDLVLKVERLSGSGTLLLNYFLWYQVEGE